MLGLILGPGACWAPGYCSVTVMLAEPIIPTPGKSLEVTVTGILYVPAWLKSDRSPWTVRSLAEIASTSSLGRGL